MKLASNIVAIVLFALSVFLVRTDKDAFAGLVMICTGFYLLTAIARILGKKLWHFEQRANSKQL